MYKLGRSIFIAASMVALAPTGVSIAEADNADGVIESRMKVELSLLKKNEHHLKMQLAMAHEISKLQSHVHELRTELLHTLQKSTSYPQSISSRFSSRSASTESEPLPPVYPHSQSPLSAPQTQVSGAAYSPLPQTKTATHGMANESLPQINTESHIPPAGELENRRARVNDERVRVEQQIQKLRAQLSTWAGGSGSYRTRTGITGLSKLNDIKASAAASTFVGNLGRVTVSVSNVHLSSGGQPDATNVHLVGSAPLYPGAVPYVTDQATGTGFSVMFARPGLQMDIGSTPTGFLEHGLTGGIAWQPSGGPFSLQASRRPVRDSLLSYAGMYDPYTGHSWGGVFANVLQIAAGVGQNPLRYGSLSYAVLQGAHVASNHRWSVDGGLRWPVATGIPDEKVHVGFNMLFMSYGKNLSFFTLGQGGYFSPQVFYQPSATVDWQGRIGERADWTLSGRLGWQTFRESSSPYFPLDTTLQSVSGDRYYPGQNISSIAYAVTGQLDYLFAPQWLGAGWFRIDNSRNYQDAVVGVSLQYLFRPLSTPLSLDSLTKPWVMLQ